MSDPDGSPVAYGWADGQDHWLQVPKVATFHFRPGGQEVTAFPASAGSPEAVTDAYCTIALPLALQVSGFEALHGSAVMTRQGVVAFCALSGTGKTMTAFGLSRRGYPLWADDVVLLEVPPGGQVLTHPLPFPSNIRAETREFFGLEQDSAPIGKGDGEPVPLAAVFVLERVTAAGPQADVHVLHPTEALSALLPHSYRFDLSDQELRRRTVQSYLSLIARAPVLHARFVPAMASLEALLDDFERVIAELPDGRD